MKFLLILTIYYSYLGIVVSSSNIVPYNSIFNFGDSLSDTGNFLLSGAEANPVIGKLPYGQTFFGHPTGRCSDGRLAIDFIAEKLGLPYLPPYKAVNSGSEVDIHGGINFAVAGATALDPEFFYQMKIGSLLWTNDSLSEQLSWFKKIKSSICAKKQGPDCESYLKKSLFVVGEIGGNDYNYPLLAGATVQQVKAIVPFVVDAIANATIEMIEAGAAQLVVPGNLPIGCSAVYLTFFQSEEKSVYDENGCLKAFNSFSEDHNEQLKRALDRIRQKYPRTNIIYVDYYASAIRFFRDPELYGFEKESVLRACCGGGGGPYNFDYSASCGYNGSSVCANPSSYANWDGFHLTEAAYRIIAYSLLKDIAN